jgi:iron complex transport system substrate-binding protein
MSRDPSRIVCLTEETTETLYLLGEQDRIVGVSGYTVRPPEARRDKPRVSAFTSAKYEDILALEPDLVLGFSDLQAQIAKDLIGMGLSVFVFNQRSIEGILGMIQSLAGLVGASEKGEALIRTLEANLEDARVEAAGLSRRPRVYFEEWNDPLISGIRWVSELIGIAGGEECFPELVDKPLARDRIIADPHQVVERQPQIIIGSWCGRKFRPEQVAARDGWDQTPAVRDGQLFEIKSADILQPGPAALSDGLNQIRRMIQNWHNGLESPAEPPA